MSVIKPCEMCGKEYEFPRKNGRFCPECRVKRGREVANRLQRENKRRYKENQKKREQAEKMEKAKKVAKSKRRKDALDEIVIKAKEAGLSYGRYVLVTEVLRCEKISA